MLLFNLEVYMIFFYLSYQVLSQNVPKYSNLFSSISSSYSAVYPCYISCHSVRTLLGMASIY